MDGDGAAGTNTSEDALTVVVDLGCKNLGVVAARTIPAGAIIFREAPLLRLVPDGQGRYNGTYGLSGDRDRCRELLATLSQHACGKHGEKAGVFERVIETNGFVVEDGSATVVFHGISRLNHSCKSNARLQWDAEMGEATVIAKIEIATGAEVTLNYGASGERADRQRHLRERFGFYCNCVLCAPGDG
jgi:hypothetical protein